MDSTPAPTDFLQALERRAAGLFRRIVFPESEDPRILDAAVDVAARGLARPALIGPRQTLDQALRERGASQYEIDLYPLLSGVERDELAAALDETHAGDAWAKDGTVQRLRDPLWHAVALVATGGADACVAGALRPTAEVLRAALRLVGPAPGIRTVSSAFYMDVPPFRAGDLEQVLTFTDAGVVPHPDAERLVEIAAAAAEERRLIVGDEPRVAFLSFSTHGSADTPSVRMVRDAVQIFRKRFPDVLADGELQADAALIPEVQARKAPGSPLGGRANVLIFPSLDAGNIAYKLVQRLCRATAIGPILQGLAKPVNDLSRGATAHDVALVACVSALQAGDRKSAGGGST